VKFLEIKKLKNEDFIKPLRSWVSNSFSHRLHRFTRIKTKNPC